MILRRPLGRAAAAAWQQPSRSCRAVIMPGRGHEAAGPRRVRLTRDIPGLGPEYHD